jgi:hypothetical protein
MNLLEELRRGLGGEGLGVGGCHCIP